MLNILCPSVRSLAFVSCSALSFARRARQRRKLPQASTQPDSTRPVWAWAEKSGKRHAVFISRQAVEVPGTSHETYPSGRLSKSCHRLPRRHGEDLLAVWTNYRGTQAQLHYRQLKDGVIGPRRRNITPGFPPTPPRLYVPTMTPDNSGWYGPDSTASVTRSTTPPGTVPPSPPPKPSLPTMCPTSCLSSALMKQQVTPWVQWQQFSETGYKKYQSSWNGSSMDASRLKSKSKSPLRLHKGQVLADNSSLTVKRIAAPAVSQTGKASSQSKMNKAETEDLKIEIPSFVTNPESASIHIPGYAVRSLPVRSMSPAK